MKDEGIVKKTQEAINEKVVPAAKEGLETAQELLGKGANFVGELLKEAGKKTEQVMEAAGEKTKEVTADAGKTFEKTQEKLIANKNDAFNYFKKNVDTRLHRAEKAAEDLKQEAAARKDQAVEFTKSKASQAPDLVKAKKGKTVVKTAAGVAVLAAAAAAAYTYYKNRKEQDEAVKAEFSEKMKKWNELEGEELVNAAMEKPVSMHVRPTKIYPIGKNALLGEDIVVNISAPGEFTEFNPDDVAEPLNPVEEIRKKAEQVAATAGETAKKVAGTVGEKAKEAYQKASEKAEELKELAEEKRNELKQTAEDLLADNKGFGDVVDNVEDKLEEAGDVVADKVEDVKDKAEDVVDKAEDVLENKMESDPGEALNAEGLADKPDFLSEADESKARQIAWEEDESVLMQKTEELRNKTAEGFNLLKEKVTEAKDFVVDKVNKLKPEELEEIPEEFFTEEYKVTIHNRGNKDYFFSPMLIQRYNSKKRVTTPVPAHEAETTLEQRIIKPGETYSGTLVLRKTIFDDAVIMFEDMLMKNSVAILLADEMDEQFLLDESLELRDDLLFEGIDDDLEDYEFAQDEAAELELDDLEIEEAEELDFDFSDEDLKK